MGLNIVLSRAVFYSRHDLIWFALSIKGRMGIPMNEKQVGEGIKTPAMSYYNVKTFLTPHNVDGRIERKVD